MLVLSHDFELQNHYKIVVTFQELNLPLLVRGSECL
jgi:hypothetical protein